MFDRPSVPPAPAPAPLQERQPEAKVGLARYLYGIIRRRTKLDAINVPWRPDDDLAWRQEDDLAWRPPRLVAQERARGRVTAISFDSTKQGGVVSFTAYKEQQQDELLWLPDDDLIWRQRDDDFTWRQEEDFTWQQRDVAAAM